MAKTKLLLVAGLCLLPLGCVSLEMQAMSRWMGRNQNELIAAWGPPQQIMSDGKGGQILTYSMSRQWTEPGYTNTYGSGYYGGGMMSGYSQSVYTPPKTRGYQAYRMFWVDSNGRIYYWSWKGL